MHIRNQYVRRDEFMQPKTWLLVTLRGMSVVASISYCK